MKSKKIKLCIFPVVVLILATSLLLTGVLGDSSTNNTNSSSNSRSVSWIYDSGLTGIAVTDVNISKDSSKDSGVTVSGFIENKDPNATKLAVTLNLHLYDKTKELLGVIPSHPTEILKPLQKIHFVVKDPTRQTAINLDHVYLQVRAFDCGTASVHNKGCFGQTVNVTKKDTNDTERKLPLVKTTLPTGVFESKVSSVSNLSAIENGDSYDILGKIKNISNETKKEINLIVETYNSTNHLVGVDQGNPIFSTLRPNEESPFKVNTNVPRFSNDHYVVTVRALESAIDHPLVNATLSTNTTINNNSNSNAVLGSLFLIGEDRLASYNRINETYTEISYVGNRTIMPTQGVTTVPINATETGKLKLKTQSNGITLVEGQSILVTKGGIGDNISATGQQENATARLVDLNGLRAGDPRISAGVAFFSTNSTGKLAFLDKMIAICQVKGSPGERILKCGNGKVRTNESIEIK
jgi:hypothetical protein